jgi:uncharacterized protein (DUF2267 family)
MAIALRDDITYILLEKIHGSSKDKPATEIHFDEKDFTGRDVSFKDVLGHIDYLNQKNYLTAQFSGDPYGGVDPLPPTIRIEEAALTDKGRQMLEKMEANPPRSLREGPAAPILEKDTPFLEKVQIRANLPDIFDARDLTVIIFRTMRDLMNSDSMQRVEQELHTEAASTENKSLQAEIAELWKDTNPIVSFLSQVRPPLNIDGDLFLQRIRQEGSLPKNVDPETAVEAVFTATKDELSNERIQEIAGCLPNRIRQIWEKA